MRKEQRCLYQFIGLVLLICLACLHLARASDKSDSLSFLIQTASSDSHKIAIQTQLAETYYTTDPKMSLEYLSEAIAMARQGKYLQLLARALYVNGLINSDLGWYKTALANNQESLEIYKALGNYRMMVNLINNMGNIYWFEGNYTIALEFYNDSEDLIRKNKLSDLLLKSTGNKALCFDRLNQFDSATYYYHKAFNLVERDKNYYGIGLNALNIGVMYRRLEKYDSAAYYLNLSKSYIKEYQPSLQAIINLEYGKFQFLTGNYDLAQNYLDTGYAIASKHASIMAVKSYHQMMFEFDTIRGRYKDAVYSFIEYSKFQDSIHTADYNEKLAHFKNVYDLDKKDAALLVLEENKLLSDQKIHSQRLIILLVAVALFVTMLAIFFLAKYIWSSRDLNEKLKKSHKQLAQKNSRLLKRELELKEINKSKNKLFSIIAHDIKNPLYAMLRLGDVLEDKYEQHTDKKRKGYLKLLNATGRELVNLTENLLSWSRYQIGNIKYSPTDFQLLEAVNFAIGIFEHQATIKDIKLLVNINPKHVVCADYSMTLSIIRNLSNNAIKFTGKKGCVEFSSREQKGFIKLSIKDNGIGMPPELVDKLFLIEQGTSRPGTEGEKGSGLGMTICREFAEMNKGDIGAESQVGLGTTVWVTLPKL